MRDERRRWDVLPEVYEAVARNRASRVGLPASFSDMAWCLSSLTEVLIRADYYGDDLYRKSAERFAATNAMGPGETVRLDHVMIAKKDPHVDPEHWLALEFAAFMRWVDRYSRDYSVKYLSDYFADYNETLRLSICSGNGEYENGDPARGCACHENWLGDNCELPCPACVNGVCAPGPVDADGNATAVCACDEGWAGTLCDVECPPAITPDQSVPRTSLVSPRARATPGTAARTVSSTARRATTKSRAADPPPTSENFPGRRRLAPATIRRRGRASCASWCARSPAAATARARTRSKGGRTTTPRCRSARGTPRFADANRAGSVRLFFLFSYGQFF